MTPTDPASAGELSVAVTGDISNLLDALDESVSASDKAGVEIAQALAAPSAQMTFDFGEKLSEQFAEVSEGAKTAGETFEQFADRMKAGVVPAFEFSEAAQDVIDTQKKLQDEWRTATEAFVEISAAFSNGSASMLDVARAQEEMQHAFEKANPLEHEASEGFGEMAEKLGELAAGLGVAMGIEEIGKESLKAFAHVQDLTTAFTLLSGSAEKAEEQIALIKEIGIQVGVPMEQLEAAAQRMTVSLGGFEKTLPVLRDAADVAAITGRSFDTVAGAIERMALSGNAGSRQLVALGITATQLGEAMDVSADKATKAFKALSVEDRLQVLDTALAKTSGAASAMAQNLSHEFTTFRNELDDSMEEIGKALEPVASVVLTALSDILSGTRPVLAAFAEIASSSIGGAFHDFSTAATEFGFALSNIPLPEVKSKLAELNAELEKTTHHDISGWAIEFGKNVFTLATGLQALTGGMTFLTQAFSFFSGKTKEGDDVLKAYLASLAPLAPKLSETGQSAAEYSKGLQSIIDKQAEATAKVSEAKSVLEEASAALKEGKISQGEYNAALAAYDKALEALHPKVKAAAAASKEMNEAMLELSKVPLTLENAMNAMAAGVNLEGMKTKIQALIDKIREMAGVGTKETDALIAALANANDRIASFATSGATELEKIITAQKKADDQQRESKIALDALSLSYEHQIPLLNGHQATLAEVERAQKAYNATLPDGAKGTAAVGEAASSSAPKIIDVASALRTASNAYSDVAAKALLVSQNFTESAGVIVNGKTALVSAIQDVDAEMGKVVQEGADVTGEFGDVAGAAGIVVTRFHDLAGATTDVGDAMVYMSGKLETAANALAEVNAKALEELDLWGQIDAASSRAADSIGKASSAGSSMGSGGGGKGGGSGSVSGAQLLQMYAAMGAPDSVLDQLAQALGFVQTGNRQYMSAQEFAGSPTGQSQQAGQQLGAQLMQQLEGFGMSVQQAGKVLADLETQVAKTGKSISVLVDEYLQHLQDATKVASDGLKNTGNAATSVPWVTFTQRVDEAGNAIQGLAPAIDKIGHTVYNVDAHLQDIVGGISNEFQPLVGAGSAPGGAIQNFSQGVKSFTDQLGDLATVLKRTLPTSGLLGPMSGATNGLLPYIPITPGSTSVYTPPAGAANMATLGTNQGGLTIQVFGNSITSQDSAQRLLSTIIGGLRTVAGIKL